MSDMTPSDRELVDEYASRLLDADVSRLEIPPHLAEAVESRLVEFARVRDTLRSDHLERSTVRSFVDSDSTEQTSAAVNIALASMNFPDGSTSNVVRLRKRHVVSALAAAAAVALLVAIGLSDRTSTPDEMSSDEIANDDGAAAEPAASFKMESSAEATVPISEGDASSPTEAPAAVIPAEAAAPEAASDMSSGGASAPDVELSNVDDLQAFLESEVVANGRLLDGVVTRVPPLCPDPDGRPAIERGVWVEGRPAELHWSATDGAVVYLVDDCSAIMYIIP